ncbi:MT-A70-domain-containing protein [Colletotrichum navitas]|uniref:MT-A70-domain-containing protein n=1 Tax=Colletotrichum navitas TaxID=681940 RepID=A0AAD8V7R0_9PEZI|nr:MT-A70-domain-containing protein [Colletotrichum navitas]KAK1597392.1 MT-A70-domain-containing protein [Colletotrichum navitas]
MTSRPLSQPSPACFSPRSILFQNEDRSVVLIDIPASLEESQFLLDRRADTAGPQRRLLSADPITTPFCVPEPRDPLTNNQTPASQLAGLMIEAAVGSALDTLEKGYSAPFCLPRVTGGGGRSSASSGSECSKKNLQDHSACQDAGQDTSATAATAAAHFIPEESAYLSGSIQETREAFLSTAPRFDLIVLDPPWPNKSARRKTGGYSTAYGLKETRALLDQIPVAGHLAEGGLVAIWVTNKATLVDLLTSPRGVLASWGLEVAAEWVWVKITTRGEPVLDPGSVWRKPWERLIVARRRGDNRRVPQRVIAAVPDVHSRKPNLRHLFDDQLPRGYLGLEVFARNLTAGWWGWGNEVLRFQESRHWIACPKPELRTGPEKSELGDTNTN